MILDRVRSLQGCCSGCLLACLSCGEPLFLCVLDSGSRNAKPASQSVADPWRATVSSTPRPAAAESCPPQDGPVHQLGIKPPAMLVLFRAAAKLSMNSGKPPLHLAIPALPDLLGATSE
jgi:hypothetical protein